MGILVTTEEFSVAPRTEEFAPVIDAAISLENSTPQQVVKFDIPSADLAKTQRVLREVASAKDRTARVHKTENENGTVTLRVWTTAKQTRARKNAKTEKSAK